MNGRNMINHLMFVIFACLIGLLCLGMVGLALYTRRQQGRSLPPATPALPSGRAAIIIPSKGAPPDWLDVLNAWNDQIHPDYDVYVCVETADEPGISEVRDIQTTTPRLHLVVAGATTHCSQQNHNMLAGVRAAVANETVWLAFADNDIQPESTWLANLLKPLSRPEYHCSTGYRWIAPRNPDLPNLTLAAVNLFTFSGLCVDQMVAGSAVWGGSFALSRAEFMAAGLDRRWAETISDDMTLLQAMQSRSGRSYRVPELLLASSDSVPSVRAAMAWFTRQIMIMRIYHPWGAWGFILPVYLLWGAGLLALPLATVLTLMGTDASDWWGLGIFTWSTCWMTTFIMTGLAPTRHRWVLVLTAPLLQVPLIISLLQGLLQRGLHWSGRSYTTGDNGRVSRIETTP